MSNIVYRLTNISLASSTNLISQPSEAKYGLLFKLVNDARLTCTYTFISYAGKPENRTGPFYIIGIENHMKVLVNRFMEYVPLQERNISMDRLYTSNSTFKELLSKGITIFGRKCL